MTNPPPPTKPNPRSKRKAWVCVGVFAMTLIGAFQLTGATDASASDAFQRESSQAMDRMMQAMAVKPTGDVDRDFAAMMIPHHQGAIDMALSELKYGHNEQLRRIAQEIIVDQQQEIAAMRLALGQDLPPSLPVPTQGQPASAPLSASHTTPRGPK